MNERGYVCGGEAYDAVSVVGCNHKDNSEGKDIAPESEMQPMERHE